MSSNQNKKRKLNEKNIVTDSIEEKFYKLICEIEEENDYYINYENVVKDEELLFCVLALTRIIYQ